MSGPVSSSSPRAQRGRLLRSTLSALKRDDPRLAEPPPEAPEESEPPPTAPHESGTMVKNTVPIYPPILDSGPPSEGPPRALRPHELAAWRRRFGLG
jgi:hypothetical protein